MHDSFSYSLNIPLNILLIVPLIVLVIVPLILSWGLIISTIPLFIPHHFLDIIHNPARQFVMSFMFWIIIPMVSKHGPQAESSILSHSQSWIIIMILPLALLLRFNQISYSLIIPDYLILIPESLWFFYFKCSQWFWIRFYNARNQSRQEPAAERQGLVRPYVLPGYCSAAASPGSNSRYLYCTTVASQQRVSRRCDKQLLHCIKQMQAAKAATAKAMASQTQTVHFLECCYGGSPSQPFSGPAEDAWRADAVVALKSWLNFSFPCHWIERK